VILPVGLGRVSNTTVIKQHIPLHFINEESCKGVKLQGGKVKHTISDVLVICEAGKLPEFIEVDLADAEVGTILHLSDLKLPEGVEILELTHGSDHDSAVLSIDVPKGAAADEDGEASEEAPAE
jgi:large subunit ribosomal protein L25